MSKANEGAARAKPRVNQSTLTLLLWCLMGLLVPRASLYGEMAPFGVSLAAAVPTPAVPVYATLAVGYFLLGSTPFPLRYLFGVGLAAGARWVLSALPAAQTDRPPLWLSGAVAAASVLLTGFAVGTGYGLDGYRVLIILTESLVAGGCALFFRITAQVIAEATDPGQQAADTLSMGEQVSLILTGAVVIMAACTVSIGGCSLGRCLAALGVLWLARAGRETGGSVAGVVLGAAVALSAPEQTLPATVLAFGGLLAGLFSRFGRLAEVAVFWCAAGILAFADPTGDVLPYLWEWLIAGGVVLLFPASWDNRLRLLLTHSREWPAVEGLRRGVILRLRLAADGVADMAESLTEVTDKLAQSSAPDATRAVQEGCQPVCASCPLQGFCWDEKSEQTARGVERLGELLSREGHLTPGLAADHLERRCTRGDALADGINRAYERYLARESAWQRLGEIQSSLTLQFSGMHRLLRTLAEDLDNPDRVDTEISAKVLGVCEDFGVAVKEALCLRKNRRLTVELLTADYGTSPESPRFVSALSAACGVELAPPTVALWGDHRRVTFSEPCRYRVEVGQAQITCAGESLCGDALSVFLCDGKQVAVLGDGMGSGGRAAVDGAMAVGLTTRLWQAGFSPDSLLPLVNASLLAKGREESLSTLDAVAIDLAGGRVDWYKAGAAPSLLLAQGRVSRVEQTGLPTGILPQVKFAHSHDWLGDGDMVLMFSDGVLGQGIAPVEEWFGESVPEDSAEAVAKRIATRAAEANADHPDDITVVALRIQKV